MKTTEAIEQFLMTRRARRVSPKTIQSYGFAFGKLSELFPDDLPESPNDIYRLLLHNSHLAPHSALSLWRHLRAFWNWIERAGVSPNIMADVQAPVVKRKLPIALSFPETQRLLRAAKTQRDLAIVAILLDTGIRLGELASMTRENVSPLGVRVSGKTGDRLVPISPGVLDLVNRQGDNQYIWVGRQGRLGEWRLARVVKNLMIDAGIKSSKLGPHTLRHTFAVQYITKGGDVASLQRILGHQSIETTMIYTNLSLGLIARQHRKFSPMATFTSTNEPDEPAVDRSVLVAAGRKSGQVRRARKAERDAQVLDMLGTGMMPREVAAEVNIAERSVTRIRTREVGKVRDG